MVTRTKKTSPAKKVKSGRRVKSRGQASRRRRNVLVNRTAKVSPKKVVSRALRRPRQRPGDRVVQDALKSLDHAYRQLELSGSTLLKSIADVQESAITAQRSRMIQSLVSDHLLQDLSEMRTAFEAIGDDQLSETLRPFALLPQALEDWLENSLGIRPILRPGQEMEIPRERLGDYVVSSELPTNLPTLVRIRVTSRGWQSPTGTLIKPSAVLVVEPMTSKRD